MKYFLYSIVGLLGFSQCISGDHFFEFDEIQHYSIKEAKSDYFDIIPIQIDTNTIYQTPFQKLQDSILLSWSPHSILTDTNFITDLKKIGFKRKEIPSYKFRNINSIFREQFLEMQLSSYCVHVFRDILIFKKRGKTIGIAKICLSCWSHQIIGTDKRTIDFGQNGDYGRLERLLYDGKKD